MTTGRAGRTRQGPLGREISESLMRLRVLRRARRGPIFGSELRDELTRRGRTVSPGVLYPLLHRLRDEGHLEQIGDGRGSGERRYYRLTTRGDDALSQASRELFELASRLAPDLTAEPAPRRRARALR
jgi:DNA-binding PadR family transcriptional regulator